MQFCFEFIDELTNYCLNNTNTKIFLDYRRLALISTPNLINYKTVLASKKVLYIYQVSSGVEYHNNK